LATHPTPISHESERLRNKAFEPEDVFTSRANNAVPELLRFAFGEEFILKRIKTTKQSVWDKSHSTSSISSCFKSVFCCF
jgi:hypothetical protein